MLPTTEMICERCGGTFTVRFAETQSYTRGDGRPIRPRKYCSRACAFAAKRAGPPPTFRCAGCGITVVRKYYASMQGYDYKQRFCSAACGNSARRKGSYIDKHGYRILFRHVGKRVLMEPEHRAVMSQVLGRALTKAETVHHKNGKRLDNRPENLELWSSRHGRGQRVTDQIEDARLFLAQHGHGLETFTTSDAIRGVMACV